MGFGGLFGAIKDVTTGKGAVAILSGQPGYFYDRSKDNKEKKAQLVADENEAAIVKTKGDVQDAANQAIIDARKRRRASSLLSSGTPLGGDQTALGLGSGVSSTDGYGSALSTGGY